MAKRILPLWLLLLLICCASPVLAQTAPGNPRPGASPVVLEFFWSAKCPHCQQARPFIEELAREYAWLEVRSHELTSSQDNVARYQSMAAKLGEQASSVPAFFICDRMYVGYDQPEGVGRVLRQALLECRDLGRATSQESQALPLGINPEQMSLPLFTLTIAALDAFNPCAFFVLLFLLSLMVNARQRGRMLLIGGVFVLVSGLLYFLFMAAWLQLFLLIGAFTWVTLAAGLLALLLAAMNIKDYFLFRQGPSLSLTDNARAGLFERMRGLLRGDHLGMLLLGTVTLAAAANSYELLCTAGFPMVYTRVLTLQAGSDTAYYLYLALYNLIYVIPLLLIVLLFTLTMGRKKLSETEGRTLKLLSGIMMALLGGVLLIQPELLNHLYTGAGLLVLSLLLTLLVRWRWSGT
jgi:thiol-disulfide isomerase/thioredoxin